MRNAHDQGRGIHPASTPAIHSGAKILNKVGVRAVKRTEVRAPGNPSEKTDFFNQPKTNEVYDFIRFARTLPHGINTFEKFRRARPLEGRSAARKIQPHYPTGRGRFSKHFAKDGNPSATLLKAKHERYENWRTLQELAGII